MKVVWTKNAKLSYGEELEFIFSKWNLKEVEKFTILVEDFIDTLKSGTLKGKLSKTTNIRSFVISKQTKVYFKIIEETKTIELLLFWNNKQDPKKLKKKLQRF